MVARPWAGRSRAAVRAARPVLNPPGSRRRRSWSPYAWPPAPLLRRRRRPGPVAPADLYFGVCEQAEHLRTQEAERLEAASVGLDADPLLLALEDARARKATADAEVRRLLAYGREFHGARPYRLDTQAQAGGMTISASAPSTERAGSNRWSMRVDWTAWPASHGLVSRGSSPMRRSSGSSSRHWGRRRRTPHTGRPGRWRQRSAGSRPAEVRRHKRSHSRQLRRFRFPSPEWFRPATGPHPVIFRLSLGQQAWRARAVHAPTRAQQRGHYDRWDGSVCGTRVPTGARCRRRATTQDPR